MARSLYQHDSALQMSSEEETTRQCVSEGCRLRRQSGVAAQVIVRSRRRRPTASEVHRGFELTRRVIHWT